MNFLAHLFLSKDNEQEMLGNFIGDFVKGKQWQNYPLEVQRGIVFHRNIDYFTDHHPITKKAIDALKPLLGRYAGIAVDVVYDYFLASNFSQYAHTSLEVFVMRAYKLLQDNEAILPEKVKELLPYMVSQNWLLNYGNFEGITQTLTGLTKRIDYKVNLVEAIPFVQQNLALYKAYFEEFFSDLQAYKISIDKLEMNVNLV